MGAVYIAFERFDPNLHSLYSMYENNLEGDEKTTKDLKSFERRNLSSYSDSLNGGLRQLKFEFYLEKEER